MIAQRVVHFEGQNYQDFRKRLDNSDSIWVRTQAWPGLGVKFPIMGGVLLFVMQIKPAGIFINARTRFNLTDEPWRGDHGVDRLPPRAKDSLMGRQNNKRGQLPLLVVSSALSPDWWNNIFCQIIEGSTDMKLNGVNRTKVNYLAIPYGIFTASSDFSHLGYEV